MGDQRTVGAKMTAQRALEMRIRRASGADGAELAASFGVSKSLVTLICTGQAWADAGGPLTRKRVPNLASKTDDKRRNRRAMTIRPLQQDGESILIRLTQEIVAVAAYAEASARLHGSFSCTARTSNEHVDRAIAILTAEAAHG